jgi:hypothetical protein
VIRLRAEREHAGVIYWTLLGFAVAIGLLILLSPYLPERADSDDGPFTTGGSNDGSGASCGDAGGGGDGGGSCD